MQIKTFQTVDVARGQAFLADSVAVQKYRIQHGTQSLMPYMGDGDQFLVKHCDVEQVNLISLRDFAEKIVSRDIFNKGYFVLLRDEMSLHFNPSPELVANFNKDAEAYAQAASLCHCDR